MNISSGDVVRITCRVCITPTDEFVDVEHPSLKNWTLSIPIDAVEKLTDEEAMLWKLENTK